MEPMEMDPFGAKIARFLAFVIGVAIFIAFMSGGFGWSGSEIAGDANPYRRAIPAAPTATPPGRSAAPQGRSADPAPAAAAGCSEQMIFWGCQPAGSAGQAEP